MVNCYYLQVILIKITLKAIQFNSADIIKIIQIHTWMLAVSAILSILGVEKLVVKLNKNIKQLYLIPFNIINIIAKMSEAPVTAAAPIAAAIEKKATKKVAKKPSAASTHPPTQQMVDASIKNLKERGGSSLLAIKKYIAATYKCDAQKLAPFIKKYLKSAVANGKLIQTKGKGASGSFKLSVAANKVKAAKPVESKKKTAKVVAKKETLSKKVASGDKKAKKLVAGKKLAVKKSVAAKPKPKVAKTEMAKSKTIKAKSTSTISAKAKLAKSTKNGPGRLATTKKAVKKPAAKK